jgi:hypothetical protein
MSCIPVVFRSFDYALSGLKAVSPRGDGYTIDVEWYKSYVTPQNYEVYYNIYYATNNTDTFSEGIKFISNSPSLSITLRDGFKPGDVYYFAVRATAFPPGTFNFALLPVAGDNLAILPETALSQNISSTDLQIPVIDATGFPGAGTVQIGTEIIGYSAVDLVDNTLILANPGQRGLYGTQARSHTTDGYDGYNYTDGFVRFFSGFEDKNSVIGLGINKFSMQYPRTNADGYKDRVDVVTSAKNLAANETEYTDFPMFDYAGYRRTSPKDLLSGKCLGTYFGGELGCADGYDSLGGLRGVSVQDQMLQRQEMLLETDGDDCILFKRMWEGKVSKHYDSTKENTAYRGLDNHGTSLVGGYSQYFYPRNSSGRIKVRFSPIKENFERQEAGLENVFTGSCWTLVVPVLQDGDFIIRFNKDGTEEWRYEILDVERNKTLLMDSGLQKFTVARVRKTDPICQVRVIRDTSMFPKELLTGIGMVAGPGGIPAHMHRIVVSQDKIVSVSQINQTTSIAQGHTHDVVGGEILESLGHTHKITL